MGAELVVLVDVVVTGGSSTTSGLGPPHVAVQAPVVKLVPPKLKVGRSNPNPILAASSARPKASTWANPAMSTHSPG